MASESKGTVVVALSAHLLIAVAKTVVGLLSMSSAVRLLHGRLETGQGLPGSLVRFSGSSISDNATRRAARTWLAH